MASAAATSFGRGSRTTLARGNTIDSFACRASAGKVVGLNLDTFRLIEGSQNLSLMIFFRYKEKNPTASSQQSYPPTFSMVLYFGRSAPFSSNKELGTGLYKIFVV